MTDEKSRKGHNLSSLDAVRLLCNAIQKVQHAEMVLEGVSPPCRDPGELMLQNALYYLAYGDTDGARDIMEDYDAWFETGVAPWPYDGGPPSLERLPGRAAATRCDDDEIPF